MNTEYRIVVALIAFLLAMFSILLHCIDSNKISKIEETKYITYTITTNIVNGTNDVECLMHFQR